MFGVSDAGGVCFTLTLALALTLTLTLALTLTLTLVFAGATKRSRAAQHRGGEGSARQRQALLGLRRRGQCGAQPAALAWSFRHGPLPVFATVPGLKGAEPLISARRLSFRNGRDDSSPSSAP